MIKAQKPIVYSHCKAFTCVSGQKLLIATCQYTNVGFTKPIALVKPVYGCVEHYVLESLTVYNALAVSGTCTLKLKVFTERSGLDLQGFS